MRRQKRLQSRSLCAVSIDRFARDQMENCDANPSVPRLYSFSCDIGRESPADVDDLRGLVVRSLAPTLQEGRAAACWRFGWTTGIGGAEHTDCHLMPPSDKDERAGDLDTMRR